MLRRVINSYRPARHKIRGISRPQRLSKLPKLLKFAVTGQVDHCLLRWTVTNVRVILDLKT